MARIFFVILFISSFIPSAHAYWQQHVKYDIDVTLIDSIHTLDGTLKVLYTNNSPDTLHEVYFHLYSNAFQPGSMMDERAHAIGSAPIFDRIGKLPPSEWGKYWINSVTCNDQQSKFEITGTIMRVILPAPLAPGTNVTISLPFREQIPRQIRRSGWMSREGVEYSMSQWYPKICEYDVEGWQHQEYIAREFYGVWGEFDVSITLPSQFTVGASGECVNPAEAKHGYERIAAGEKEGAFESDIAAPGMTTWKFHASPVHDFAWVADDRYIHEWATMHDTITVHALYKTWVANWWNRSAIAYSMHALSTYSELYGAYPYHNFSCTMAGDGGMEYPQLIMITGYRPSPLSLAGVIAHEAAHQWFYGLLGSNETREAFMDEGFTTYATTIAMDRLFGDNQEVPGTEHSWLDWFVPKFSNKRDNYRGYQQIASQHYEEPLDIPHDWFREDATAGQVYGKTAAILNMLEYALGDSVFAAGMKEYYNEWHFKHPHLVDFKRVMEKTAHTDLDWFFDEWFKTTRTVDYEAESVTSRPGTGDYAHTINTITLHNRGLAVMPIDLLLHFDDGSTNAVTIPLSVNKNLAYRKDHRSGWDIKNGWNPVTQLPPWDWTSPDYSATFEVMSSKILQWFEIDTSWRLQDLNWLNNYSTRSGLWSPPGEWAVWKQLFVFPPIDKYWAVARPIVWYEAISGVDVGAGIKFGMNNSFSGDAKIIYRTQSRPTDLTSLLYYEDAPTNWYDQIDGAITYSTPVDWLGRLTSFSAHAEKMYGIGQAEVSLSKVFRPEYWRLGATHEAKLFLETDEALEPNVFPVYHAGWAPGVCDVAGITYSIEDGRSDSRFDLLAETSVLQSNQNFSLLQATYRTEVGLPFTLTSKLRLTAGAATSGTPFQRRFFLDRANNFEEQANGFFRAVTAIDPHALAADGDFFVEGGAGVRGYNSSHYNSLLDTHFVGTDMYGASWDIALPNPAASLGKFPSSFSFGAFADAGWVGQSWEEAWGGSSSTIKVDAGIKVGVDIRSWLPSQLHGVVDEYDAVPIVNLYWPMYENAPVDGRPPFAWRWAVSLGAAF